MIIPAFLSCSEKSSIDFDLCNECVLIDENLYETTTINNYTINNATLTGDLLTVQIVASGCDGNSWKATFIDANEILESNPIQRNGRIRFENNEACLAVIGKEFTFNLKKLKENQQPIILNLDGWNTQINYN